MSSVNIFLCIGETLLCLVLFQGMFCGLPDDQDSLMAPHQICSLETVFFEIVPDAEGKFEEVTIENGFDKY